MTLEIPGVDRLPALIERLEAALAEKPVQALPEWIDLETACTLKGVNYSTARGNPKLRPNGGWPDGRQHNRDHWRRETVLEWLEVSDETRDEYLAMCMERRQQKARYAGVGIDVLKALLLATLESTGEVTLGRLARLYPMIQPKRWLDAMDTLSIEGKTVYQSDDGRRIGLNRRLAPGRTP